MSKSAAHARLDDPDDHFPYKLDDVRAALAEDAPAGPNGPDDDVIKTSDLMSDDIAAASARYIEAQARVLTDTSPEAKRDYDAAADALVAARRYHRRGRTGLTINGQGA